MSNSTFPILSVKDNVLTSIDGNKSFFYKIIAKDLSQMDEIQVRNYINNISNGLNQLDTDSYYKFYQISGDSYLQTNSTNLPAFHEVEFERQDHALEIFFGAEEIWSDTGVYDDYISFNGKYIRIFSVSSFSEDEIYLNFIPKEIDYVLHIRRRSKDKAIRKLDNIRSSHLASFMKSKRDFHSEGAYSQAENLLQDLILGNESMFDMEMFFIIGATSLSELNLLSETFFNEMNSRGVRVFSEGQSLIKFKSGLTSIFNELIPGVRPKLNLRLLPNKTGHLKHLLPLHKSYFMKDGIQLRDQSGEEVYFNPFAENLKNRNMLVTGISGGGKSVFVNKIVHNLIQNHPTVILDKGGSFKKLTVYHGGNNLGLKFNPFQFKDPMYLREIILSVVDKNKFEKLEKGKLLKCIKEGILVVKNFWELLDYLKTEFINIDLY